MRLDKDSEVVTHRLQAIGYSAEPIRPPGTHEKSADLWARRGGDCLVVEVKSRVDDAPTAKQVQKESVGTIVERTGTLGRRNWLSAVVEDAARQVQCSQEHHAGLGLLWFRAIPALGFDDSEAQLVDTLLGVLHGGWKRGDEWGFAPLYAADYSDFYRFPVLDAAVIEVAGDKGRLVINPYSPRKQELQSTRLYSFFSRGGSILDIDRLEPPKAFVLRADTDRRDRHAVWKALCDQYPGYQFMFSSTSSWGAVVQVHLPRSKH